MSPALGYTGGLSATRNVCNLKSHAHKAGKCLRSEGKNEWLTAAVKLRYHTFARLLGSVHAASSWAFSPLLFTKKKETWQSFVSMWTLDLKSHRPPGSAMKFAERQGSCLPLLEHLIEHLLACTPVSPSVKMVTSAFLNGLCQCWLRTCCMWNDSY